MSFKFLIVDGYDRAARERLLATGCNTGGELYARMIGRFAPDARYEIVYPADGDDFLPRQTALTDFDSLLWTGSSLNIYDGTPAVLRQIALAKATFEARVPAFGSCWALHIATAAAGGECRLNPRGREFGVTRKVALTREGQKHPLFKDKPISFDAFTSHFDEVYRLPSDSLVLATNSATAIQAACIRSNQTDFWAVQYHPEYDLREIAALTRFRSVGLLAEGRFRDEEDLKAWTAQLEALHENGTGHAEYIRMAWRLGLDSDLTDSDIRCVEFRNWLDHLRA
ncbi:MAG: type 1 glutamine amidotransferase [Leptospirales bacterium]|jgi:GMP synthase (glutamine-hydrolysing)